MSRKPFTYTFGELIDRLSILSKKDFFQLPGSHDELNTVMHWLSDLIGEQAYFILSIIRVTQANNDIWHLEHELRNAAEGDIPLDEVGRRAIKIREHNKTRVRYVNELDNMCGASHVTEKIKHLSAEIYDKFYREENNNVRATTTTHRSRKGTVHSRRRRTVQSRRA